MPHRSFFNLAGLGCALRNLPRRWDEHEGWQATAAVAYHASVAVLPAALLLMGAVGWVLRQTNQPDKAIHQVTELVTAGISPWMGEQIEILLRSIHGQPAVGGPIGLIGLSIAALGMFVQLEAAIARIWGYRREVPPGWIGALISTLHSRAWAFAIFICGTLFMMASFVINGVVAGLATYAPEAWSEWPWLATLRAVLAVLLNALLLTVMYHELGRASRAGGDSIAIGLLVAGCWQGGVGLLEWFVLDRSYSPYGVLGALLAVMVWVYYAAALVLIGAELLAELQGPCREAALEGIGKSCETPPCPVQGSGEPVEWDSHPAALAAGKPTRPGSG